MHRCEVKHMVIPSGTDISQLYILSNLKWSLLKYFSLQNLQYNFYHIAFLMFRLCVVVSWFIAAIAKSLSRVWFCATP